MHQAPDELLATADRRVISMTTSCCTANRFQERRLWEMCAGGCTKVTFPSRSLSAMMGMRLRLD